MATTHRNNFYRESDEDGDATTTRFPVETLLDKDHEILVAKDHGISLMVSAQFRLRWQYTPAGLRSRRDCLSRVSHRHANVLRNCASRLLALRDVVEALDDTQSSAPVALDASIFLANMALGPLGHSDIPMRWFSSRYRYQGPLRLLEQPCEPSLAALASEAAMREPITALDARISKYELGEVVESEESIRHAAFALDDPISAHICAMALCNSIPEWFVTNKLTVVAPTAVLGLMGFTGSRPTKASTERRQY